MSAPKRVGYIDGRRLAGFTLSGASALNGILLTVTDASVRASGDNKVISIPYAITGAFTGGNAFAINIEITVSAVVTGYGYIAGLNIDLITSGDPDLSGSRFVAARLIIREPGSTMNMIVGLMIEKYNTTAGSSDFAIMFRNQGLAVTTNLIGVWGTNKPTYLFTFQTTQPSGCFELGDITSGKSCIYGLRCLFQSTVGVIPVYED